MRVALVGDSADVHVKRWLGAIVDRGYDVWLLSSRPADVPGARWRETPLYAHDPDPVRRLALAWRRARDFRRALRELRPDVFHAYGLFSLQAWSVAPVLAGLPIPRILTVLGSDVIPRGIGPEGAGAVWLKRWLLSRAETVTASSEYLATHVRRYADVPVEISAPGVDLSVWGGRPSAARAAATDGGAQADRPPGIVIGFCKRLLPAYGADLLLRAACQLLRRGVDVRLLIVGDGPERGALEALGAECGLAGRVEWAGAVPHAQVSAAYRRMDLFCMPTRIDEALGVSALEAQAAGVPVVAARIGGIGEAVADGVTGVLVPPDDVGALAAALEALARDPGRRRALGAAGPAHVAARFSWDRHVARLETLYGRAVAARRAPARRGRRRLFLHFGDAQGGRMSPQVEEKIRLLAARGFSFRAIVPDFGPVSGLAAEVRRAPMIPLRGLRGPSFALTAAGETARALGWANGIFTRYSPWFVPAYLLARLARLPIVAELHGTHDEVLVDRGWRAVPARLLGAIGLRLPHACVVGSTTARDFYRRRLGHCPLLVLSNGAPAALAKPVDRAGARASFGFGRDEHLVLHLGTLGGYFPRELAVEAIRLGAQRDPRLRWVFAGTGLEGLRARVDAVGLASRTVFLGWVPPERVRDLAGACDAGALLRSGAWDEISGPAPLKLFTYMACALPIVASDVPGVAGPITQADCGRLVRPDDPAAVADAIAALFEDPAAAAAMGRRGREAFLASYTWERVADRLAPFLNDPFPR